jgi:ribosomal protein S18 acetylase RimI-like enzyme
MDDLDTLLESEAVSLLVATDAEEVVGILTLVIFPIPTGVRAWIEDVVVDQESRGSGVGEALCAHAFDIAGASGAKTIDLTSRPSREAANALYLRLGFEVRETNVYRFSIEN